MKNTMLQSRWKPFILSILFFAVAFTVGTFLHWPTADAAGGWIIFVKLGAVFGLIGAIYGAIYAFDIRFDSANMDRPVLPYRGMCRIRRPPGILFTDPQSYESF